MKATTDRFTRLPTTRAGWWTAGLGSGAVLVGPLLGFGLVALLMAAATFGTGITAYRRGERSWLLWLGMALAIGVACYLPTTSTNYPYTNE